MTDDVLLGVGYLLLGDEVPKIAGAARETLLRIPAARLRAAITPDIHPKILEFLIEFRQESDNQLAEQVYRHPSTNDRTALLIAQRADPSLCEVIASNHIRLLLTPAVLTELQRNSACPPAIHQRAESFLRMQGALPEPAPPAPAEPVVMDLEAEIEAALAGRRSPALMRAQDTSLSMFDLDQFGEVGSDSGLGGFRLNFEDQGNQFSWNLTAEREDQGDEDDEERV